MGPCHVSAICLVCSFLATCLFTTIFAKHVWRLGSEVCNCLDGSVVFGVWIGWSQGQNSLLMLAGIVCYLDTAHQRPANSKQRTEIR
ncbi:hypothetical protein P153DRAFT_48177 [Dothidotthia symphoricarpi CBS 119687]|uniref:Uncharacterized protein n=1 Tax=Dothidotthia symphoricarpi CBS 119687 TaxID=1392245 RepID=A0A6A6ABL8_9PLEO|nr:uncharacterized protein P153DRAFT_48177 [Dothidotthia symphoricarpi CBS 119687]KAF2128101.1 hypothetical protein P153DRAFT_48177 [Dothidotthia symphoricarpi CBS 119687]